MEKTLEELDGKVICFKTKENLTISRIAKKFQMHLCIQTGLVKNRKDNDPVWFIADHRISLENPKKIINDAIKSKFIIYTKTRILPSSFVDMRTIKEIPEEEQIIWRLEHNM